MAGFQVTMKVLGFITYSIVMALAAQVAWWAMDRKPPFVVVTSQITPPTYPGGQLLVEGKVERDLSRNCRFTSQHWIEDRSGYRHYLPEVGMSTEDIRRVQAQSPGYAKYAVPIPVGIPLGPAVYHITQSYACNPVHMRAWPIEVETRIPFTMGARP